jgi:hypothetical protein
MSVTYKVLVSDSMLAWFADELAATGSLQLPAGLTLAVPLAALLSVYQVTDRAGLTRERRLSWKAAG